MPLTSKLRYFARYEFEHPELVNDRAAQLLDEVRHRYGKPLKITDDAREPGELPPGASPTSLHYQGKAFDLRTRDMTWGDLWDLTRAVFSVALELQPHEAGVEFELVWSKKDKHAHIAFALDGRRNRLIVAAD